MALPLLAPIRYPRYLAGAALTTILTPLADWHNSRIARCMGMTRPAFPEEIDKYREYREKHDSCVGEILTDNFIMLVLAIPLLTALISWSTTILPKLCSCLARLTLNTERVIKSAGRSVAGYCGGQQNNAVRLKDDNRKLKDQVDRLRKELDQEREKSDQLEGELLSLNK